MIQIRNFRPEQRIIIEETIFHVLQRDKFIELLCTYLDNTVPFTERRDRQFRIDAAQACLPSV